MKVLQICNLPSFIKQHLRSHIDHLEQLGFTVESICPAGEEADELKRQGYVIHCLPIDRKIDPVSNIKCISRLIKAIRYHQYDVVHVHNPVASILGRIAAKIAGVKKIIYTTHGLYIHDLTPPLEYIVFQGAELFAAQLTDLIFSVNQEDIDRLKNSRLCPAKKLFYLGSVGVNTHHFDPARIAPATQQALKDFFGIPVDAYPIIGTIGRINEKKGSLYLVEAIAKLRQDYPKLHTLIIGEEVQTDPDGCQNRVTERIEALGLKDCITLTGYREDIPELISLMDVFTLPTFAHEGLPSAVIEAMAMEKPVVASNIRGCREAIIDHKTGFIIPPKNVPALAGAIIELLQNPAMITDMGKLGRKRVKAEYSEELVLQRLANGYAKIGLMPTRSSLFHAKTESALLP